MSGKHRNLSEFVPLKLQGIEKIKIGIIISEWNGKITERLREGAIGKLIENGVKRRNLFLLSVPGSFELPFGAQMMIKKKKPDAVICLGCLIKGETPHFEFISEAVAKGIMDVGLKYKLPVIFGVLTTNTLKQAMDRSGGKYGNKGVEAAVTALKMVSQF